MYEPFKSIKPNLESSLEQALQATNVTLSQFERMTTLALDQIKKNANFVEDQLEAAMHLQDPSNWWQFFQEQFSASQQHSSDVAHALFELSQEFHAELLALAQTHIDAHWPQASAESKVVVDLLQQALQTSQASVQQASRAAKASAELTRQAWAQAPRVAKRSTRSATPKRAR